MNDTKNYLREQAESCRNRAKLQFDPKARTLLLAIAEHFDRLASQAQSSA